MRSQLSISLHLQSWGWNPHKWKQSSLPRSHIPSPSGSILASIFWVIWILKRNFITFACILKCFPLSFSLTVSKFQVFQQSRVQFCAGWKMGVSVPLRQDFWVSDACSCLDLILGLLFYFFGLCLWFVPVLFVQDTMVLWYNLKSRNCDTSALLLLAQLWLIKDFLCP
jgi:hypothetical protein